MKTFIYSKWKTGPLDSPIEFYSELDFNRWETRKVEIYRNGRMTYASNQKSTGSTRLAIVPIPPLPELESQPDFETSAVSAQQFEAIWLKATQE